MPVIRRPPGGGHGNPLQYSCLENPRDGGAWQAAIYGVTQSWTRLKWLSSSSSSSSRNTWFIFFLMSLMLNGRQLHTGSQISCLGFNWWIWRIWDVLRLYPIFFFFKSLFLFQRPVFCSQQNWAETTDTPPTPAQPPQLWISQHPHGTFVTTEEPTLTHHYHPVCSLQQVHSWCYPFHGVWLMFCLFVPSSIITLVNHRSFDWLHCFAFSRVSDSWS